MPFSARVPTASAVCRGGGGGDGLTPNWNCGAAIGRFGDDIGKGSLHERGCSKTYIDRLFGVFLKTCMLWITQRAHASF